MSDIRDFHAHIYFDAEELLIAEKLARDAAARFELGVGRMHVQPVGPHPRGSCQLTVHRADFGDFAQWAALNRSELTIFAHANTGDDLADHTDHVIWFGESEALNLAIFA